MNSNKNMLKVEIAHPKRTLNPHGFLHLYIIHVNDFSRGLQWWSLYCYSKILNILTYIN